MDRHTGEIVKVKVFIGVAGFSHYAFVKLSRSEKVIDWLALHCEMLAFFGGVPQRIVPDNLRSAVTKAGRVPDIQRDFLEFAEHYGTAVIPAPPRSPEAKAPVELSVLHTKRAIFPELEDKQFYSLEALDEEVQRLTKAYNEKPFTVRQGSRKSQFDAEERAALMPLPKRPFVYYERISRQKVPVDYHLRLLGHHYSVPHRFIGYMADARATAAEVQIYVEGECVAIHRRGKPDGCTTVPEHQTEAHRAQAQRTPEEVVAWGKRVGPFMEQVIERQFTRHKVRLQGLKAAFAVQDLQRRATGAELEALAKRALSINAVTPADLKRLLQVMASTKPRLAPSRTPPVPLSLGRSRRRAAKPRRSARAGQGAGR